jgi:N-acetylmuramoyl-L-alanine amidase
MPRTSRIVAAALLFALLLGADPVWAQTAKVRYEGAFQREAAVRTLLDRSGEPTAAERRDVLRQVARVVTSYEGVVRRYPTNGYSDNALWQGAALAEAAYRRFGRAEDRITALRLYRWLINEYPTSSLVRRARTQVTGLQNAQSVEASISPTSSSAAAAPGPTTAPPAPPAPAASAPVSVAVPTIGAAANSEETAIGSTARATLGDIQRAVLPGTVRVTLELDREVAYHEERITGPDRVFFDLKGAQLAAPLTDKVLSYSDDIVRQIRTGRHPNGTVRVVLELDGVARYSVFTLYNPFRIVIDCERATAIPVRQATVTPPARVTAEASSDAATESTLSAAAPSTALPAAVSSPPTASRPSAAGPVTLPPSAVAEPPPAPAVPLSNGAGGFSLSRQLGLSVSRIVIDPGHGGRDPGAGGNGVKESVLTLDIALRLEKLLEKEAGIEVILTRRSDVYVDLEERTAIANRESADLFLSIHANAARNTAAHGVETYYLSFASSPDAESVAARENSASKRAMHNLPDIIKSIALNNKLDESRDLAAMVQEAMVTRMRGSKKDLRNLGVKKAPFVVLIGAGMPSVLAEVSFLTNRPEAQLLKTSNYKQRIAEALHEAVMKYRQALKRQSTIADRP